MRVACSGPLRRSSEVRATTRANRGSCGLSGCSLRRFRRMKRETCLGPFASRQFISLTSSQYHRTLHGHPSSPFATDSSFHRCIRRDRLLVRALTASSVTPESHFSPVSSVVLAHFHLTLHLLSAVPHRHTSPRTTKSSSDYP